MHSTHFVLFLMICFYGTDGVVVNAVMRHSAVTLPYYAECGGFDFYVVYVLFQES